MLCECRFCGGYKELARRTQNKYPSLDADQCLYKVTESLFTTVDEHPIIPESPYFLLIPHQHITSFAQMNNKGIIEEMEEHFALLRQLVAQHRLGPKNNMIIFEHGQSRDGNAVKSVYHAHVHVMFTDYESDKILDHIISELRNLGVDYHLTHSSQPMLTTIAQYVPAKTDYLYFCLGETQIVAVDNGQYDFYSQFFRVILAKACSQRFIDWKEATSQQLAVFEQRLHESLPHQNYPPVF